MNRISSPIAQIKDSYDVVVIGSGYGGAIAASRLSRAGQKVCLLERGEEILPGQYPDTAISAAKQFQINTGTKQTGPDTGLYDLNVHDDISVLVGCGLGGTSLINANVSIKPEPRIFEDDRWPSILRNEYANDGSLLQKSYALAADMLKTTPLPEEVQLKKLTALQRSAKALNEESYRLDINVNFDIDGLNHVGVEQKPCNHCGDCCSGCNYSAKNTLLMNYLPDAKNHGAEIFCKARVSHIEKEDHGYEVHFKIIGTGQEKFNAPNSFIKAKKVVVSAGTLGSTEILLRSKENGLDVSPMVGHRFSGNGDVLAFGYNTDYDINGIGSGNSDRYKARPVGPTITGVIDARYKENLDDGMVIEDAAIPGALSAAMSSTLALLDNLLGEEVNTHESFSYKWKQRFRKWHSVIRGAYHGAVRNTQTFLVMSTDSGKGQMSLKNDRLQLDFPGVGDEPIYEKVDRNLKAATKASKGDFIKNPVWSDMMGNELITVHPLGGCSMGESFETGVVNHKGQVFSSTGIHEGLYVTDGSVIPRAVGVNPLYTICALSERMCSLMAMDNGWNIGYELNRTTENETVESKVGIQFTETMKGYWSKNVTNDDFDDAAKRGKMENGAFKFTLTINSDDVYTMMKDPNHQASMIGTVEAPLLSKDPLSVTGGIFNLFVDDPNNVATKLMKYSMVMNSEEGKDYFFYGYKRVHNQKNRLDMWPDTSTLFITIYEGRDASGTMIGQGKLRIHTLDFAKQMTTMKAVNAPSKKEALKAVAEFGKFFSKSLFEVYGRAFVPNDWFNANAPEREHRKLDMDDPVQYDLKTEDGHNLLLTRYKGGDRGPLLMLHGFSGNRYTFDTDTNDVNAAEYFYHKGFDVWLLDYRLSSLVESSNEQHTIDEVADYDLPAAVDKVRELTGANEIDVLAHCVGSISMFMALLKGMKGVRSLISAQIAIDFKPRPQVGIKTGLKLPSVLEAIGVDSLSAYTDTDASIEEKLYNGFIKLYADHTQDFCDDPSCQRMCFMFGPLIEHEQLNDLTHKCTIEMFGRANVTSYKQLSLMIRENKVLRADGSDDYIGGLDNLNIPITFIHGEKNGLFDVKSTLGTYTSLCKHFGPEKFEHHIIKGYGHNDCMYGKNAHKDVFPIVLKHLDKVSSAPL